jgi:hypothetical protein
VRVGRLSELINTACIESMDFLLSKEPKDWHSILKGGSSAACISSALKDQSSVPLDGPIAPLGVGRSWSGKPRSMSGTRSPLTLPFNENLLRDHSDAEKSKLDIGQSETNRSSSPSKMRERSNQKYSMDAKNPPTVSPDSEFFTVEDASTRRQLHLSLDDPSEVPAAAALLIVSENLYDQADLLHYLQKSVGNDFNVKGVARVRDLLEEVYIKSMQMKEWSIVRLTAGLLNKTVNSITTHIADLLVRQRPVTIGSHDHEYFIDNVFDANF